MGSPRKDPDTLSRDYTLKNSLMSNWNLPKTLISAIFLISLSYLFYSLILVYSSNSSNETSLIHSLRQSQSNALPRSLSSQDPEGSEKTSLKHIVFGIGAASSTWEHRRNYIKLWWKPDETRGYVWLNKPVKNSSDDYLLPQVKISADTSKYKYKNPIGSRDAIRMARIVLENLRLGLKDVRWFVMGDDDTVFITDNLVRVLSKYDHNQFYYIGAPSESHLQNLAFYYSMGFGGGGFAISYPLAKALENMLDECLHRYPSLYGSDERVHACLTELGVPLTREQGFHQFDLYGNLFGLLSAHPIAPLVSLHHLDVVDPIFPTMDRVKAIERLLGPMKLDSAALLQQSICYDKTRSWTVSVSWGYSVQIYRGIVAAKEMAVPSRTFIDWNFGDEDVFFAFNSRPVSSDPCLKPFIYYLSNAFYNVKLNQTASEYFRQQVTNPLCQWKISDPARIERIEVYKKPDPFLWDKPPRRNCCRVLPTKKKGTMVIDIGTCEEGEIIGL